MSGNLVVLSAELGVLGILISVVGSLGVTGYQAVQKWRTKLMAKDLEKGKRIPLTI